MAMILVLLVVNLVTVPLIWVMAPLISVMVPLVLDLQSIVVSLLTRSGPLPGCQSAAKVRGCHHPQMLQKCDVCVS